MYLIADAGKTKIKMLLDKLQVILI